MKTVLSTRQMDRQKLISVLIITVGVLAYANSFSVPFIFDDVPIVTSNPNIRHVWPLALGSRFVVDLSFKLNYAAGGLIAADYHAVNLVIHIMAGLLLFGIIRHTLLLPALSTRYHRSTPWVAAASAGLWVVHPLQTESVTYICQRYESMMGMFYFLCIYCFVRAVNSPHQRRWYNASLAACAVGMGTKEIMVTAPIIILLYDYIFLAGSYQQILRVRWKIHASLFGTWGILFFLILGGLWKKSIEAGEAATPCISPLAYLISQFRVITHYLRLAIFPYPLCLDYAWQPVEGIPEVVLPGTFLAVLVVGTLWALWRRSPIGFLGAFFFILLTPTSSILPLGDIAFEHRMYLPLAAVIVLPVTGAYHLLERGFRKPESDGRSLKLAYLSISGLVTAALVCLTLLRNADYRSEETIWRDVVEKCPHNFRAHVALISALLAEEKFVEAEDHARRLLALIDFAKGPDGPIRAFGASNPEQFHPIAYNQLGRSLLGQGKTEDAIESFSEAIGMRSNYELAYHNRALALFAGGKVEEAIRDWEVAIAITPDYGKAYASMAFSRAEQGQFDKAIKLYWKALELVPDLLYAKYELAWLLATCPDEGIRDGRKALELAVSVCEATDYGSAHVLDLLATAYAEAGRFDDAVKAAEKAIGLKSTEEMKQRLSLYRQGKPYRSGHSATKQNEQAGAK